MTNIDVHPAALFSSFGSSRCMERYIKAKRTTATDSQVMSPHKRYAATAPKIIMIIFFIFIRKKPVTRKVRRPL